ncbi:AAC(3) family N-acetyltransferase [Streptomyces sp. NPDC005244]|uniref:AAC(3) family N-acetyltransferase n=1 Tax=Streptomyces sp. NPDC005244 TaxID=3364708 RepID=UPI00368218B1
MSSRMSSTVHDPDCHLGEGSPLGALYAADARVLLFRVGFEVCSAFHLAECRLRPVPPLRS